MAKKNFTFQLQEENVNNIRARAQKKEWSINHYIDDLFKKQRNRVKLKKKQKNFTL